MRAVMVSIPRSTSPNFTGAWMPTPAAAPAGGSIRNTSPPVVSGAGPTPTVARTPPIRLLAGHAAAASCASVQLATPFRSASTPGGRSASSRARRAPRSGRTMEIVVTAPVAPACDEEVVTPMVGANVAGSMQS